MNIHKTIVRRNHLHEREVKFNGVDPPAHAGGSDTVTNPNLYRQLQIYDTFSGKLNFAKLNRLKFRREQMNNQQCRQIRRTRDDENRVI